METDVIVTLKANSSEFIGSFAEVNLEVSLVTSNLKLLSAQTKVFANNCSVLYKN